MLGIEDLRTNLLEISQCCVTMERSRHSQFSNISSIFIMKTLLLTTVFALGGILASFAQAQTIPLTIDPTQSSIDVTIADAISSSPLSGNVTLELTSDAATGTGQITNLDVVADEALNLNLFGGFASASTSPGDATISLVTPGAPGALSAFGNSFSQVNNLLSLDGDLAVFDGFGFAGGNQTFDLSGVQFLPANFNDVNITQFGGLITINSSVTMTGTLNLGAGNLPATIQFNYVANGIVPEPVLLGDVNLDGSVNPGDISPFIIVLITGGFQTEADCNQSGSVNFLDIFSFVDQLMLSQ